MNSLAVTECLQLVNSHVFLGGGYSLIAFCPATVDEAHVV